MLHYILTQGVSASLSQAGDRFSSERVPCIRWEGQGINDSGEQVLVAGMSGSIMGQCSGLAKKTSACA